MGTVDAERREVPWLRSTASWPWRVRMRSGIPARASLERADLAFDAMKQDRRLPARHSCEFGRARLPPIHERRGRGAPQVAVAAEYRELVLAGSYAKWHPSESAT